MSATFDPGLKKAADELGRGATADQIAAHAVKVTLLVGRV